MSRKKKLPPRKLKALKKRIATEKEIIKTLESIESRVKTRRRKKDVWPFNAKPITVGDNTTKSYEDYKAEVKPDSYYIKKYNKQHIW